MFSKKHKSQKKGSGRKIPLGVSESKAMKASGAKVMYNHALAVDDTKPGAAPPGGETVVASQGGAQQRADPVAPGEQPRPQRLVIGAASARYLTIGVNILAGGFAGWALGAWLGAPRLGGLVGVAFGLALGYFIADGDDFVAADNHS